jgi:hypothetical protein
MSQSSYNFFSTKSARHAMLLKREYTRSFFRGEATTREVSALMHIVHTPAVEPLPRFENVLCRTAEGTLTFAPAGRVTTRLTRHTYAVDLL